jgi:hypothetical protein
MRTFLTTEDTGGTEEAFWAFLQEGAGSQRRTGVFAGVVPALTSSALLARRMPKVGTARRAVPRFRCAALSHRTKAGAGEKVARGGDAHSIDRRSEKFFEISGIECEKFRAICGEGGDQDGFVFCGQWKKRVPDGEGVRHPLDVLLESGPGCRRGGRKFDEVFHDLCAAIRGGDELPFSFRTKLDHEPGEGSRGTASGKHHAAVEEDPHALPAFFQKASAPRSSSAIHFLRVDSGMSRTGTAAAGNRKTPPSRSSTKTIGFSVVSSPSDRRISGGRVTVPRLDTGIAVMLQRCNAVEGLSNGLTTENTEEAFWAFLQEGAGSQRRTGVFAGVVPALTSSALLARRMPKVGTARFPSRMAPRAGGRAAPRFRRAAPFFCSPRPSQAGRLRYKKWDPCGEASLPFIGGRCRAGGPFRTPHFAFRIN